MESAGCKFGPQDQQTTSAARSLAIDFAYQNKYPEAEKAFREVLEMQRKALGSDAPVVLEDIGNLASILLLERKYADAEKLYREAFGRFIKTQLSIIGRSEISALELSGHLPAKLAAVDERLIEMESCIHTGPEDFLEEVVRIIKAVGVSAVLKRQTVNDNMHLVSAKVARN